MLPDSHLTDLVKDLKPVGPPRSPTAYAAIWALASAPLIVGIVVFGGKLRSDLATQLGHAPLWGMLIAAVLLLFTAARAAFTLALPGRPARRTRLVPFVVIWSLLAALLVQLGLGLGGDLVTGLDASGFACAAMVTAFSVVPMALAFLMLRRLAVMNAAAAASAAAFAAAAVGLLGISLHCEVELATHLIVYHVLPVLLIAALAGVALAKWLRW
jgi:hypothetical protein